MMVTATPERRMPSTRGQAPGNAGKKLPPQVVTPDEVQALYKACGRGNAGTRNRALVAVLVGSGIRIAEALALRPSDIDLELGTVRVRDGKGRKDRTVALDIGAQAHLETWLARRTALGIGGRAPVFCVFTKGMEGKPLAASYVRKALHKLGEKANLQKRIHPHGLRASHASHLYFEGKPLPLIQHQLGHSNAATTSGYLAKVAPADVVHAIRDRSRYG